MAKRSPLLGLNRRSNKSFIEFGVVEGFPKIGFVGKRLFIQDVNGDIQYITDANGLLLTDPSIVQYYQFTDGSGVSGRIGMRGGKIMVDITLTELGFDGAENTDWENRAENL